MCLISNFREELNGQNVVQMAYMQSYFALIQFLCEVHHIDINDFAFPRLRTHSASLETTVYSKRSKYLYIFSFPPNEYPLYCSMT